MHIQHETITILAKEKSEKEIIKIQVCKFLLSNFKKLFFLLEWIHEVEMKTQVRHSFIQLEMKTDVRRSFIQFSCPREIATTSSMNLKSDHGI